MSFDAHPGTSRLLRKIANRSANTLIRIAERKSPPVEFPSVFEKLLESVSLAIEKAIGALVGTNRAVNKTPNNEEIVEKNPRRGERTDVASIPQ
jgi:hypothetical protein